MKYIVTACIIIFLSLHSTADASEPISWMLMEAPSASDIHVENHAYQINGGFPTILDCREALTTYFSDAHRWCKPLFITRDGSK